MINFSTLTQFNVFHYFLDHHDAHYPIEYIFHTCIYLQMFHHMLFRV